MRRLFSPDGLLSQIMSTAADLILINCLWIVCSLPLITIGAATAAGHHACRNLIRQEGKIIPNFFLAFRQTFRQATLAWLLICLVAACLFVDFSLLLPLAFPGKYLLTTLFWIVVLIFLLLVHCYFPMAAESKQPLPKTLSLSLQLALQYPKTGLLLVLPTAVMTLLLLFAPQFLVRTGIFWILFGFSLPAYFQNRLLGPLLT